MTSGTIPRFPGTRRAALSEYPARHVAELPIFSAEPTFMAMPVPAEILALGPYFTVDVLDQLPDDGNRYEVVYGELLVTPAPTLRHQELVLRLARQLDRYLERHGVGHLVLSPADVRLGRDSGVQPDLFVIPVAVAQSLDWRQIRELFLVIEVLSPTTRRADRFTKRRRYQEARVPQYWIVDAEAEAVEVWTPGAVLPVIERERVIWRVDQTAEEMVLSVGELFRGLK